jgi:DNA-directed RNA polymerase specialized sigma24 family protein
MPFTVRYLFEQSSKAERADLREKAIARLCQKMLPRDRSRAEDFVQDAFFSLFRSTKLYEFLKPGLIVQKAHYLYINEFRTGDLAVEDYDAYVNRLDDAGRSEADPYPSAEIIVNNKDIIELIKKALPKRYHRLIDEMIFHVRGRTIANADLAEKLATDLATVERDLEYIRTIVRQQGISEHLFP